VIQGIIRQDSSINLSCPNKAVLLVQMAPLDLAHLLRDLVVHLLLWLTLKLCS